MRMFLYNRNRFISIFFFSLFSIFCLKNISKGERKKKDNDFFIPILIEFTEEQTPCIPITIENQSFAMSIDLGADDELTLYSQFLEKISSKVFIKNSTSCGMNGKRYSKKAYRIPKAQLQSIEFIEPYLREAPEKWKEDTTIKFQSEEASFDTEGSIGWRLFSGKKVLFDLQNKLIAFCDDFQSLKTHGYNTNDFVCTPLLTDHGLLEINTKLNGAPVKFLLDTGCTVNFLNTKKQNDRSLVEIAKDPENFLFYPTFLVESKDVGPIGLHRFPIRFPFRIEGVLGAQFFVRHVVFIDFPEKMVYFSKYRDPRCIFCSQKSPST